MAAGWSSLNCNWSNPIQVESTLDFPQCSKASGNIWKVVWLSERWYGYLKAKGTNQLMFHMQSTRQRPYFQHSGSTVVATSATSKTRENKRFRVACSVNPVKKYCSSDTAEIAPDSPTLHVPVQQFLNINKVGSKMYFLISYLGEDKKKHAKVCPAMADHSNSISRGH